MARTTQSLTDKQISNAKPQDKKYTLFDGNGLRLRVKPNGTKTWLFNYTRPHNGKRANMTFGSYPSLSLTNTRKKVLGAIETLKRICQRVNEMMSFAQNKGLIEYTPLARISSAFLKPTVTSMKSIIADELPELMITLGRASIMYTEQRYGLFGSRHLCYLRRREVGKRKTTLQF
ncbi:integrase arm-type DNA-binding domain-containing protein [Vibrio ostreae]|uniref:integrase arm-type DNA-binding domain-containing protein n=1 Tax=Vibrio ostreae TaxID=2841925 RepID=UPI0021145A41|nr:integrase arm-type DNA-binding domain-containing protein [Vibrio ostreae]